MDAIDRDEQEAPQGRFVDDLSWFAPLLAPTWLLPGVGKDAPRVVLAAEPWPEETAVDQDGRSRHLAYSGVVGVGFALNDAVTFTLEDQLVRDEDPSGATTQDFVSASLAWMPRKTLQLDVGAVAGLDRHAPDVELYAGIARRF